MPAMSESLHLSNIFQHREGCVEPGASRAPAGGVVILSFCHSVIGRLVGEFRRHFRGFSGPWAS